MNRKTKSTENPGPNPKSMSRPKKWTEEVEEVYRFQVAGYRDATEYLARQPVEIDRWPGSGYVKKLKRPDGYFCYFNNSRECEEKDVNNCKIYVY